MELLIAIGATSLVVLAVSVIIIAIIGWDAYKTLVFYIVMGFVTGFFTYLIFYLLGFVWARALG